MPRPKRSNADIIATVLLFIGQLGASGLALLGSIYLATPVCSNSSISNCDRAELSHSLHNTWTGALVIGCGVGIALLVAACGAVVSGLRGTLMWKWPALGLTIVVLCFVIALGLWVTAMPGMG